MFQDYLFFGTDTDTRYAFRMCHLSGLVEEARTLHGLNPQRAALLGEVLLGGVLLSSLLEDEERINLRVHLGYDFTAASETTRHAETKGYLECGEDSPIVEAIDEGGRFFGDLMVRSLRSKPGSGRPFEGVTQLRTDSVEEALNDHLAQSFQLKAGLRLASWCDPSDGKMRAFGAVFLELPNLATSVSTELWNHVQSLPSMREIFGRSEDPDFLGAALIPHGVRTINNINPRWSCTCSLESVQKMLLSLPDDEKKELAEKGEPLEIKCHYCSHIYSVDSKILA